MKYTGLLSAAAAAFASTAAAISVSGAAEGFAKGVTGGGSATPVYPNTIDELVSYLGDNSPRVIVLSKTCVSDLGDYCMGPTDSCIVSTSAEARVPPPRLVALPGVLALPARRPSTRTTGATTTSPAPLQFPLPSEFDLFARPCVFS